jgi:hypothetical protein
VFDIVTALSGLGAFEDWWTEVTSGGFGSVQVESDDTHHAPASVKYGMRYLE